MAAVTVSKNVAIVPLMAEDDKYGKLWDYRVFSQQWTCPDDWNVGQRYLTVHHVTYLPPGKMFGTMIYPLPDDLIYIEAEPASPDGVGLEEAVLDGERIMEAFDKPVLIKAEFQKLFDWSEKQNHLNEQRRARTKPKTSTE